MFLVAVDVFDGAKFEGWWRGPDIPRREEGKEVEGEDEGAGMVGVGAGLFGGEEGEADGAEGVAGGGGDDGCFPFACKPIGSEVVSLLADGVVLGRKRTENAQHGEAGG